MKKKIVPIVLTALMLSLTACGNNSTSTVQNVSSEEVTQEVSENDTKNEKTEITDNEKKSKELKEATSNAAKDEKTSKVDGNASDKKYLNEDLNNSKSDKNDATEVTDETTVETTTETVANTDVNSNNETTTESNTSNDTASAQSQTFNVNVNGLGNFGLTLNGDAHVASDLSGWAIPNADGSYEVNVLIPLTAQDANNTYTFEINCPDNVKSGTITNINTGDSPFNFTVNNGVMTGTATAVSEQVVMEGSSIWIYFNFKF